MKNLLKNRFLKVAVLILALILPFFFLRCNSTENIPSEEPKFQKLLAKGVSVSKHDAQEGIAYLEKLNILPEYSNYKKDYVLARLYESKNKTDKAIEIYEKILNKNYPLKERVIFHLGNLYALKNNDKKALWNYNKLLRDFSNSRSVPQAKYYLAQAQFRLKLTKEAIYTLMSLQSEFPRTQYGIASNYYLGEHSYYKGKYDDALKYWREYLKFSPDGRFAQEIASILLKEKSSKRFNLLPSDFSLLGNVFYHKKDYKNAVVYYKLAILSSNYYELAYSFFRLNNKTEAIKYFKEYAYKYPKSKYAKWALYYAARSLPSYLRKDFWSQVTKDIPYLAYYSRFKEALVEENKHKQLKLLRDVISLYPESEFLFEAVWELFWENVKDKNYTSAIEIGLKYFDVPASSINYKSEARIKLGFWLGKLFELTNDIQKAKDFYRKSQSITFDNYYSLRSKFRLQELLDKSNSCWNLKLNYSHFNDFNWLIPGILKINTLKHNYGATVVELINLEQYEEAIELIGKSKSPSKKITAWLKALNYEFDESINIASSIISDYKIDQSSPIWELAYPLAYWQSILTACNKYPEIDPLFVCALIRQESRFDAKAISTSSAYGLMQLISSTAKTTARQIGITLSSTDLLYNPKINTSLGVAYLNNLIKGYENPIFSIASYNAGPGAVNNWKNSFYQKYANKQGVDYDFFIEEIPYDETRNYVKKVFSNYWVYLELYT